MEKFRRPCYDGDLEVALFYVQTKDIAVELTAF